MCIKLLITILLLICPTGVFAADQWVPTAPQSSDVPSVYPAAVQANNNAISRILGNYRQGQVITYSSSSALSVTAGEITTNSTTPYIFRQNTSSTTVNAANLDTGSSFSSGTTYYVYAVADTNTTTNTYLVSLNASTPSGATNYKKLGYFTTDGSSNIQAYNIFNDNMLSGTLTNGSTVYFNVNANLGGKTLSNGKFGESSCSTVTQGNNSDNYCPTGCYVRGQHRDGDGSAGSLYCCCP